MTANDAPKYHVGQTLTYYTRPGEGTRVEVVRIARRYGYINLYGREVPFDLKTGRGKDDIGYGNWVLTDSEIAQKQARAQAMARVEPLQRGWGVWGDLSVDQINRIADIVEEATP